MEREIQSLITLTPVAYFKSEVNEKADMPRQGSLADHAGVICFLPGHNFEQALEDLEGMEKIWVLFWMDRVSHFKPKIQPPRDVKKKGVFSTRSPHRPNPIGLSCVTLISVSGLKVNIKDHDLLDGTPILDIKPYLPYADSFPLAQTGWIENSLSLNEVCWSDESLLQLGFLKKWDVDLRSKVAERLKYFTAPSSSNRICLLEENSYLMSYKTWRIIFSKKEKIEIQSIYSGYDQETLDGHKPCLWGDLLIHKAFLKQFQSNF